MDNFVVLGLEIFKRSRENLVKIRGFSRAKIAALFDPRLPKCARPANISLNIFSHIPLGYPRILGLS